MNLFILRLTLASVLVAISRPSAHSVTPPFSDPPGIAFYNGSWKDVLAEAKRQNKPIFLDLYTSWCPPCGRMAREAFPNPKVGEKYNARFINYQVNAEFGPGIDLARAYAVASYPTVLYIAPNGELMQRSVGYTGINGLLTQADMALAIPKLRKYLARGAKAARAYSDSLRRLNE